MSRKKSTKNIKASGMDELVFEGREKNYGAYVNRLRYFYRARRGFILSIFIMIFLMNLPSIIKNVFKHRGDSIVITIPKLNSENTLSEPPTPPEEKKPEQIQPGHIAGGLFSAPKKSHKDSLAEHLLKDTLTINTDTTLDVDTSLPNRAPVFPGGAKKLAEFIRLHLVYPELYDQSGIYGIENVTFTIKEDGTIEDIEASEDLSIPIQHSATAIVESMPKWWPAKADNKKISQVVTLPIEFLKR